MSDLAAPLEGEVAIPPRLASGTFARLLRTPTVVAGIAILCLIALMGIAAPLLTSLDPAAINPRIRI